MKGATYRDAGVDLDRKRLVMEQVEAAVGRTPGAEHADWGHFAGLLPPAGARGPLAVTIDGVGSKTMLAHRCGRNGVIGRDIVAHCANDLAAVGARPLGFLDYIAMPALDAGVIGALIDGMAGACRELGILIVGGETAEMPGVYHEETYDVVGAMVGAVVRRIDPAGVHPGDRLVGLASSGLHTNGYSLARQLLEDIDLDRFDPALGAAPADALLAPHRCYARTVLGLMEEMDVRGVAHITGGGLLHNIPRVLPPGGRARLTSSWPVPRIFSYLQRLGRMDDHEMRRVFNLGVGMVLIVPASTAEAAAQHLRGSGEEAWVVGEVVEGERGVDFA